MWENSDKCISKAISAALRHTTLSKNFWLLKLMDVGHCNHLGPDFFLHVVTSQYLFSLPSISLYT